mmetsp:Transcript_26582/g.76595  ORF Transcript_26582/g.76595 Transcript_26582/m.76595 type:complete len:414 (+) Transcript_26582:3206-4447(+)
MRFFFPTHRDVVFSGDDSRLAAQGAADEDGADCSPFRRAFCVSQGSVTKTHWKYVGLGKGSYRHLSTYSFVGEGVGSIEKEEIGSPEEARLPWCCCSYFLGILLLALAGYWLLGDHLRDVAGSFMLHREAQAPSRATASPRYNCAYGSDLATATKWTRAKQVWCCMNEGVACAASMPLPYDCTAGADTWERGWSMKKRRWCCQHSGHGCSTSSALSLAYNCDAGLADWAQLWTVGKRRWCCQRGGRGCPAAALGQQPLEHNCTVGRAEEWPASRRLWCCQQKGAGCPPTTSSPMFDCSAGQAPSAVGWSVAKIRWCCRHRGAGCPPVSASTSAPYDCNADFTPCYHCLRRVWSKQKAAWCCAHAGRGCPTTSTPQHFNCNARYSTWPDEWSALKKVWCCRHYQLGCAGPAPSR